MFLCYYMNVGKSNCAFIMTHYLPHSYKFKNLSGKNFHWTVNSSLVPGFLVFVVILGWCFFLSAKVFKNSLFYLIVYILMLSTIIMNNWFCFLGAEYNVGKIKSWLTKRVNLWACFNPYRVKFNQNDWGWPCIIQ